MSIKLFQNDGKNAFEDVSESYGLNNTTGLWMSINQADLDKDGDIDYIVGNLGENNKFKAKKDKPLHIYCNDFDNNETQDIVLGTIYKGKQVPIRGKECSTEQMPFISEKFPSYKSFANASLEELYGDNKLEEAIHYKTELLSSIFLINEGNTFTIKKLPAMAQIAPINDILVLDFNQDKNIDILLAGNMFNTEVETGSYDAGKGLLLKGGSNGLDFEIVPNRYSGIFLPNDLKEIEPIVLNRQGRKFLGIIGSNNNGKLQIFAQWQKDVIQ